MATLAADEKVTKEKKGLGRDIEMPWERVGLAQLVVLSRSLSVMLASGMPIVEALDIARDSANGKLKKILEQLITSVESGRSLSASMGDFPHIFSDLYRSTVQVGEKSGRLEENMTYLADQLEKERDLIVKVRGALIYPVVILAAALVMGVGIVYFVFPKLIPLFSQLNVELPWTTRLLIWSSTMIRDYGLWILAGVGIFIALGLWLKRKPFARPYVDGWWLKVPVVRGLIKHMILARLSRTLGTLLKSGIHIDEAVRITQASVQNYHYEEALEKIAVQVDRGGRLSESLSDQEVLFPKMVRRMVRVGERSGKLDQSWLYLAEYYEKEVDAAAKSLPSALEPMLLLGIGLGVGFLALAIMSPIFSITGGIRR